MNQAIHTRTIERRDSKRLEVDCEIYCSSKDGRKSCSGTCTTVSGSGISFTCEQPFDVNQEVVLRGVAVISDNSKVLTQWLEATVVRCRRLDDGRFEIGAKIIHL